MEADEGSCTLCSWDDKPIYKTLLRGEEKCGVCIDCYLKMIEEIFHSLVEDERERGELIFQEYKNAEELTKRLEWDFETPPLIDCGAPPDDDFVPDEPEGLMRLKER